jgi:hypothetical protein
MGTRGSFLGVMRPGCEADHSPPSSTEVKKFVELYLHSPIMPSWRGAQLEIEAQVYFHILHLWVLTEVENENTSTLEYLSNRFKEMQY